MRASDQIYLTKLQNSRKWHNKQYVIQYSAVNASIYSIIFSSTQ